MSENPGVSKRLMEQRMRNRAMEALENLCDGDAGVRSIGLIEYVEQFFDIINDDIPMRWRDWSSFTPDEVQALDEVLRLLNAACAATPKLTSDDAFIASGWPIKLQPASILASDLMRASGRFREDIEEDQPSLSG